MCWQRRSEPGADGKRRLLEGEEERIEVIVVPGVRDIQSYSTSINPPPYLSLNSYRCAGEQNTGVNNHPPHDQQLSRSRESTRHANSHSTLSFVPSFVCFLVRF